MKLGSVILSALPSGHMELFRRIEGKGYVDFPTPWPNVSDTLPVFSFLILIGQTDNSGNVANLMAELVF